MDIEFKSNLLSKRYIASVILFTVGLLAAASPWASPPKALAIGLILGIILGNPFRSYSQKASRLLLQFCVVCLGFSMSLREVVRVGRSGFVYTLLGISFAMLAGMLLGMILRVDRTNAFLVSVGTAICGGSAIAAVGKVIDASDEQMTVSLGTVFVLNSVGLLVFPAIGAALGLTQTQFGLWAALAIHDTSSVVGAGAKYGLVALTVATTVKLGRALWILPMAVVTAAVRHTESRVQYPWFILFFVLAAVLNSYAPGGKHLYTSLAVLGRTGLTITLYLIGANISLSALKTIGIRPLLQGVLLWVAVASLSLLLIRAGLIRL
ncbi:MAG: putative sulfate exporter family transporter [Terriglobales bacterium]